MSWSYIYIFWAWSTLNPLHFGHKILTRTIVQYKLLSNNRDINNRSYLLLWFLETKCCEFPKMPKFESAHTHLDYYSRLWCNGHMLLWSGLNRQFFYSLNLEFIRIEELALYINSIFLVLKRFVSRLKFYFQFYKQWEVIRDNNNYQCKQTKNCKNSLTSKYNVNTFFRNQHQILILKIWKIKKILNIVSRCVILHHCLSVPQFLKVWHYLFFI